MVKLSVIVPVYNVDKYLTRCLNTLVNQSLDDYEIILVNDGSSDNSLSICEKYQSEYGDKIKLFSKDNGGLSDARNYGIARSSGKYLAFIDSDDWIDLRMLEVMYEKAIFTNADIVVCDMEYHYDNGKVSFSSGGVFDVVNVKDNLDIMMINNSACNKIYRSSLFSNNRFPVGLWYEDMAVVPIMILNSDVIAKVDEPFYKYYQRSGSIMHSSTDKIFDIYKVIDIIRDYAISNYQGIRRKELLMNIEQLYIIHGLDINTLQIRTFDHDRVEYLKKNMSFMNDRVPKWYHKINNASFKKKVVYTLLKIRLYNILLLLYDMITKKDTANE